LENESAIETTSRVARNKALFVLERRQTQGTHMTDERKAAHHYCRLYRRRNDASSAPAAECKPRWRRHRRTDDVTTSTDGALPGHL